MHSPLFSTKEISYQTPPLFPYERCPERITAQSFAQIEKECPLPHLPRGLQRVLHRLVHACGMTDLLEEIVYSENFLESACAALATRSTIFVDCTMVEAGVARRALPSSVQLHCTLSAPGVAELADQWGTTRSAAAVTLWKPNLEGSLVVIGNAPTALFRLLEGLCGESWPSPAAILAFPVGFVGAAESKEALIMHANGLPFITLRGRRGGSALAAACLNALLFLAEEERCR